MVAYHGDLEKKAAMEKQREVHEVADNKGESDSPNGRQLSVAERQWRENEVSFAREMLLRTSHARLLFCLYFHCDFVSVSFHLISTIHHIICYAVPACVFGGRQ